jgi:hypothetical protein
MDSRVFGISMVPRIVAWQPEQCTLCPRVIESGELYGTRFDAVDNIAYCEPCSVDLDTREAARG